MPQAETTKLEYRMGSSDKVYQVILTEDTNKSWCVIAKYGPRNNPSRNTATKAREVTYATAAAIYQKTIYVKQGGGYTKMI